MLNGDWRNETLKQIGAMFQNDEDVISLSFFGSTSKPDSEVGIYINFRRW